MKLIMDETLDKLTKGVYIGDVAYTGINRMPWAENDFENGNYGDAIIGNTQLGDFCEEACVTVKTVKDERGIYHQYPMYPGVLPIDVGNLSCVDVAAVPKAGRKEAKRLMLYYPQAVAVRYRLYQCKDYRRHVWDLTLRPGVTDVKGDEIESLKVVVKS